MKKYIVILLLAFLLPNQVHAFDFQDIVAKYRSTNEEKEIKNFLNSQVRYANRANVKKFLSTYDDSYISADGFDKKVYTELIKDIWNSYDDLEYSIVIKNIKVNGDKAVVMLDESSRADIFMTDAYDGILNSFSKTVYYLEKNNKGKWKVVRDKVEEETTTMLYGAAKDLKIKMDVPKTVAPNKDYLASLEFVPPKETIAIASLAADIVEYPQKPTKEVFRTLPEDNILERFFTSNKVGANEYVVASIGLTKTAIEDLSLKLSLVGFGYAVKRVNVKNTNEEVLDDKIK